MEFDKPWSSAAGKITLNGGREKNDVVRKVHVILHEQYPLEIAKTWFYLIQQLLRQTRHSLSMPLPFPKEVRAS